MAVLPSRSSCETLVVALAGTRILMKNGDPTVPSFANSSETRAVMVPADRRQLNGESQRSAAYLCFLRRDDRQGRRAHR